MAEKRKLLRKEGGIVMSAKILLINGSPRPQNNSSYLLDKAREGVLTVSDGEDKL